MNIDWLDTLEPEELETLRAVAHTAVLTALGGTDTSPNKITPWALTLAQEILGRDEEPFDDEADGDDAGANVWVGMCADLCNWFWYDSHPDFPRDGTLHTSSECRRKAREVFDLLGLNG